MESLEQKINYQFKNKELAEIAMCHTSYVNENKKAGITSNERLEFLGDAVLSIVVSDYLFKNYSFEEGDLSKLRASLVCEKTLKKFADEISLGEYIKLGKGEENTGGKDRPSIVSDAFEALIAAIYLDGGIEVAAKHILRFIVPELDSSGKPVLNDYKTALQEIIQQNKEERVVYVVVSEEGPDHDKRFEVEVHLNSNVIGRGVGRSKKQAEQLAAKEALELMGR